MAMNEFFSHMFNNIIILTIISYPVQYYKYDIITLVSVYILHLSQYIIYFDTLSDIF